MVDDFAGYVVSGNITVEIADSDPVHLSCRDVCHVQREYSCGNTAGWVNRHDCSRFIIRPEKIPQTDKQQITCPQIELPTGGYGSSIQHWMPGKYRKDTPETTHDHKSLPVMQMLLISPSV